MAGSKDRDRNRVSCGHRCPIEYVEIPAYHHGPDAQFVEVARCTEPGCGRGWKEIGLDTRPPCQVLMFDGEPCDAIATWVAKVDGSVVRCCGEHAKDFRPNIEPVPPRHHPKVETRRPGTGYY